VAAYTLTVRVSQNGSSAGTVAITLDDVTEKAMSFVASARQLGGKVGGRLNSEVTDLDIDIASNDLAAEFGDAG
jgi:hypothetical protein